MSAMGCESVTDLLPDRLNDRLSEVTRLHVDEHLEQCADCRDERDALRVLRRSRAVTPASLKGRVLVAVRSRPAPRRRVPGQMAAAASVVLALITGGLLLTSSGPFASDAGEQESAPSASIRAVRQDDPLLHGGPGLGRLSVDELQALLAELDS